MKKMNLDWWKCRALGNGKIVSGQVGFRVAALKPGVYEALKAKKSDRGVYLGDEAVNVWRKVEKAPRFPVQSMRPSLAPIEDFGLRERVRCRSTCLCSDVESFDFQARFVKAVERATGVKPKHIAFVQGFNWGAFLCAVEKGRLVAFIAGLTDGHVCTQQAAAKTKKLPKTKRQRHLMVTVTPVKLFKRRMRGFATTNDMAGTPWPNVMVEAVRIRARVFGAGIYHVDWGVWHVDYCCPTIGGKIFQVVKCKMCGRWKRATRLNRDSVPTLWKDHVCRKGVGS